MPSLFDVPQKMQAVDTTGAYGVVLQFATFSVKVVRLLGVLTKREAIHQVMSVPVTASVQAYTSAPYTAATAAVATVTAAPTTTRQTLSHQCQDIFNDLCVIDETLLAPVSIPAPVTARSVPPPQLSIATVACPPPVTQVTGAQVQQAELQQTKLVTKVFKGTMPSERDLAEAVTWRWAEVPWRFREYDFSRLPTFEEEIHVGKSLAAVGIAPYFRGTAIYMHGDKPGQLLTRCKHATSVLLNLTWLRNAIWSELYKLQRDTPHAKLYCGVIVTDHCTCTLASLEGPALSYVRANARLVQQMLDDLHLAMLQAGVLHLDIAPSNIGCCFSNDYQKVRLRMLDFGRVCNSICIQKLYTLDQAVRQEIVQCINTLTEGIVDSASVMGADREKKSGSWVQRWLQA
jgi:hypothetical protein